MATQNLSPVEKMFNLISWDDENKLEAVVDSLTKLGEKHPEALQKFLEIFLAEQGFNNTLNIGDCANCACGVSFQLDEGKLVYRCENDRCENH